MTGCDGGVRWAVWWALGIVLLLVGDPARAGGPPRTRAPQHAHPAQPASAATADPVSPLRQLPPEVLAALQRAQVPLDAVSVVVHDATSGRRVLETNAERPTNPASLMKLLTTLAALDQLGPAWSWTTPVWINGPLRDGVLDGSLYIQGSGDPKLVIERLWLLLRQVQQLGVREIRGDIVIDQGAFVPTNGQAGDFDGEPLRPYNVRPAALMLNFRSVSYAFAPDPAAGIAVVRADPPLAGTVVERSVPLLPGPCGDWRGALKAEFEPGRTRFAGGYIAACGEQSWPLADPEPATYDARLLTELWQSMGGTLRGSVREGPAPADRAPSFEFRSLPLLDVVRDINKFSNNLMAQQLFLTLARQAAPAQPATQAGARDALRRWLSAKVGDGALDGVVVDNGSGLSRDNRVSARLLARLLTLAFDSPVMSELMSSLPISGVDGTMRRSRASPGRAHLKTGSLRDVVGRAGYVLAPSGRRLVLVALVQHANAGAARPALDGLVQWALRDTPLP